MEAEADMEVDITVVHPVAMSVASMATCVPINVLNVNSMRGIFNKQLVLTLMHMIIFPWRHLDRTFPIPLTRTTKKQLEKTCSVIHNCVDTLNPHLCKSGVSPLHRQIVI